MPSPVTVLHALAPAPYGGLERVVQALATGHSARGHHVHVALILDSSARESPLGAALARTRAVVHVFTPPPRAYLAERRWVSALCQQLDPDVVHTHGYRADVLDAGAGRRFGIPTLTTVHGFTGGSLKNRIYESLQIVAFRRFDAVVAVSKSLGSLLVRRGVPSGRVHTIVNAWQPGELPLPRVEARQALGLPPDGFRVGFVGRLTREKGADVLLEAAALLRNEPVAVSVLGDGAERQRLEARAEGLGLGSRISWHGAVPNAARLMHAFDVVAISSRTEGTPIVLFEAIAAGVPVVATSVGGIPDVVTGAEALLVPPEDPRALADALLAVSRDPASAAVRCAAAARRLQERFGEEPWLSAYEGLYRDLASRLHGPGRAE